MKNLFTLILFISFIACTSNKKLTTIDHNITKELEIKQELDGTKKHTSETLVKKDTANFVLIETTEIETEFSEPVLNPITGESTSAPKKTTEKKKTWSNQSSSSVSTQEKNEELAVISSNTNIKINEGEKFIKNTEKEKKGINWPVVILIIVIILGLLYILVFTDFFV